MLLCTLLSLTLTAPTTDQAVLADPALAKRVTYTTRATNISTALAGLTKASGVTLVDSHQGHPAILLLKLNDVPLRDVMVRIAKASGESWMKEKDTFKLVTTEEDASRARDAANAAERPAVIATIQQAKKDVAAANDFTPAAASALANTLKNDAFIPMAGGSFGFNGPAINKVRREQPIGRLINTIVSRLDPELILAQPFGMRTVLSTQPDALESQLPIDVSQDWAGFFNAQNLWADAVNSAQAAPRGMIMEGNFVDRLDPQALKLDVVIDRTRQLGTDAIGIELVTAQGEVVASNRASIPLIPPKAEVPPSDSSQANIFLTEDERTEIRRLLDGSGMRPGLIPLSSDLRKRLEHPDQFEPLATFVSSILLQSAEQKHQNIVACLPDRWLQLGAELIDSPATKPMSWLLTLSHETDVSTSAQGQWIEVDGQAKAPQAATEVCADRKLLATLLASGVAGKFSAESIGRYAIDSENLNADALFSARVGTAWITDPDAGQALRPVPGKGVGPARVRRGMVMVDDDTWNALRLIGGVAKRAATSQITSQQLGFNGVDESLRTVARDAVFYQGGILRRPEMGADGRMRMNQFEPFDLYPGGIPGGATLALEVSATVAVLDEYGGPVTPFQVARNTFSVTHGSSPANGPTMTSKFQLGPKRSFAVSIALSPNVEWSSSYDELQPPSSDPMAFQSLPAAFVRQAKAVLERLEKSPPSPGRPPVTGGATGP